MTDEGERKRGKERERVSERGQGRFKKKKNDVLSLISPEGGAKDTVSRRCLRA